MYDAQVLYADTLRENVEVHGTQLGECQLVCIVVIVTDKLLYVSERLHTETQQHTQIDHRGCLVEFCIVDGSDVTVELLKRLLLQVCSKGITIERDVLQTALLHEGGDTTAVGYYLTTYAAKLIVCEFEHTCQSAQRAVVLHRCLYLKLVSQVMLYV